MLDLLFWALVALVTVGVFLPHELGRYAFARLAKLPIERVRLRVLVQLGGRERLGAQLGALTAGLAAAYLGVAALAFASYSCRGVPTGEEELVVQEVLEGFDAVGKLQPGDRILAVDGEPLGLLPGRQLVGRVAAKQGAAVTLTVRRGGAPLDVTIQPTLREDPDGRPMWRLGIRQGVRPEVSTGVAIAAASAIRAPLEQTRAIVADGIAAISEAFEGGEEVDAGGPVRIVDEFRGTSEQVSSLVWWFARSAATPVLLLLVIFDLIRAAGLALGRVRARR